MAANDEEARKARARRLREQIKKLEEGQKTEEGVQPADQAEHKGPENPRDFIHRKMRELDQEKHT